MKYNENFIGYEKPNTSIAIDGIIYKYNNFGHRCKNVEDIDLENYILFAGCSHTEGEGLHLEETYPYLTAKELGTDYYNLGIRSSGFDVLFYNIMQWLALYPKPKLIVLQYPDATRFAIPVENSRLIVPVGSWRTRTLDFLLNADELGLFTIRNFWYNKILNNYIKSPVVKLNFGGTKSYDSDAIRVEKFDLAIDNLHYGFETHTNCSEVIVDSYYAKINI
jgi:hypothetical protein